jgi:hypothetical protein
MLGKIQEIVILNDGSTINGEVLLKQFVLKLKYGQLKLSKLDILSIEFKHPPFTDADEVQVSAGTRLRGDLSPAIIPVRIEDSSQVIKIPKTDIHSMVFFTGKRKVSVATRKALKVVA